MPGKRQHREPCEDPYRDAPISAQGMETCLRMVEIALRHGNREQAKAAIDRVFDGCNSSEPIVYESPLTMLGLSYKTVALLEKSGIDSVGGLASCTPEVLMQVDNCGVATVESIRAALHRIGWKLRGDRTPTVPLPGDDE